MIDLKGKPFYLTEEQVAGVQQKLAAMSTREKVGQLFCVMGGSFREEERVKLVKDYHVGGVLFRPAPAEEVKRWYEPLDAVADLPLLKCANLEEGGYGAVSDGTMFGFPMQVAAANDLGMVEKFAQVCASEAMSVGTNVTFSPVADIDVNFQNPITNVRTYGSDVEKVRSMCDRYVQTLQNMGMAACAKHFPGDGVDHRDQHLHPSYNSLPAAEWYASYGSVYQTMIDHGLMSVMVGHIVAPYVVKDIAPEMEFEDMLPATLSPEMLQGVLRGKLGFNGMIFTDATIMGGFTMALPRAEALPRAIEAGCDMLVFNTDFYADYENLLAGVEQGILSRKRLDEAVARILAMKAKVGAVEAPQPVPAKKWRKECADLSVTLVKDKDAILPISQERFPHIRLVMLGKDDTPDGSLRAMAEEKLRAEGFDVEVYDPMADEMHPSHELPQDRLTLYFANLIQFSNQTAIRINWCPKHAMDAPKHLREEHCAMVSFANPYLLQDVPRMRCYINAYTATEATVDAVIDKLLGRSEFKGVSPVDPFCGLMDTHF